MSGTFTGAFHLNFVGSEPVFRDLMWVFPPRSWKLYSVSKQSWVKCSLHTDTYLGSGRPNLLSRRIWSSHCLATSGFFTGKLWKLTPLTLSLSDLLLQPGTEHDGIFLRNIKTKHAGNLSQYQPPIIYAYQLGFKFPASFKLFMLTRRRRPPGAISFPEPTLPDRWSR